MYFVKIRLFVFTTFVNGCTLTCFQCLKQKLLNWCKLAVEFFPAFKGLTLILSPEKKEGRSRKGGRRGDEEEGKWGRTFCAYPGRCTLYANDQGRHHQL